MSPRRNQRKKQDRFAHKTKVANRSFVVSETLSRGCGNRRGSEASPSGEYPEGLSPLGDSLVTFSSGRKSPGVEGRSALPMGGAQRRAKPSSLLRVQLAELCKGPKRLQRRLRRQLYKKTGPQSPVFSSRILGAASRSPGSGRRGRRRRSRWCPPKPARPQNHPKQRCSRSA